MNFHVNRLLLLVFLFQTQGSVFAQKKIFKLDDLKNKTWIMQGLTDKTSEEVFTDGSIESYLNGKHVCTFDYYLSNSPDTIFDSSKVKFSKKGNYIIKQLAFIPNYEYNVPSVISVFEIIKLNSKSLVIRNIKQSNQLEFRLK
jgi:hypothetical protein